MEMLSCEGILLVIQNANLQMNANATNICRLVCIRKFAF